MDWQLYKLTERAKVGHPHASGASASSASAGKSFIGSNGALFFNLFKLISFLKISIFIGKLTIDDRQLSELTGLAQLGQLYASGVSASSVSASGKPDKIHPFKLSYLTNSKYVSIINFRNNSHCATFRNHEGCTVVQASTDGKACTERVVKGKCFVVIIRR